MVKAKVQSNRYGAPAASQNQLLLKLGAPHVNSFNFTVNQGLKAAIDDLNPVEFLVDNRKIRIEIVGHSLDYPQIPAGSIETKTNKIYPTECRQRHATYSGKFLIDVNWYIDGQLQPMFTKDMGNIPIMVKSNRCNLETLNPKSLIAHGEHEHEWGGYFIISGLEKIVRLLLMPRRNYPNAIRRSTWKQRGPQYSDLGISIRCVKIDGTSTTNVLHYITDGSAKIMFSYFKQLYYIPICLLLKCLCDYTDWFIFKKLTQGYEDDLNFTQCCQNMLRGLHSENFHSHTDCKSYFGSMFKVKLWECPPWYTDTEVADFIMDKCILIHLNSNEEKFDMLVFMLQKLFHFSQDKCVAEGVDSVMMQEVQQGGYLYLQIIKENLQSWMHQLKNTFQLLSKNSKFTCSQSDMLQAAKRTGGLDRILELFLATGNIRSKTGLGMMQDKGLTIIAENINRTRFMSHFKAVHRGAFFQEMRTTEVRQLLPDAWGFICPVHTPDGAPCGLLNHLTLDCFITNQPDQKLVDNIVTLFLDVGMVPMDQLTNSNVQNGYAVQLDGKILGYIADDIAVKIINHIRLMKIEGIQIPNTLEIVFVQKKKYKSQFPGIFMFSGPSRMMRPVMNLNVNKIELIGTFEQVYLDICVNEQEIYKDKTSYMELSKTAFLSSLAQLIPMPDCNQSPRNMYQCQMSKQTMGTPCHTWHLQSETKLYRLQTPGRPLFRPVHNNNLLLDDFAMGTNAIVAVISYTGYDMEDAMIINKASEERGLCHGQIYKTEIITLEQDESYFSINPNTKNLFQYLDKDGLPFIGRKIVYGEPLYSYFNSDSSAYVVMNFKGKEECYIDAVKLCGDLQSKNKKCVCISFRVPRNPSVGDKFASRAGQKGICSKKWPVENLPFTETGLVPDIIFNPHGFPSRMTIAMMIELMAGKSAALHGLVHDATPFEFSETDTAINYFGKLLESGGYNYYGTETLYSGTDGREMEAMIFFGIVYYQRLRHMVSDKWQVRSTGPIDTVTHQPIKGRKKGGGVRFGEMERDALISHGIPFLLQDRLLNCSDKTIIQLCTACGSILSPMIIAKKFNKFSAIQAEGICMLCGDGKKISSIKVPHIFKFFVTQLASCNINVTLTCQQF